MSIIDSKRPGGDEESYLGAYEVSTHEERHMLYNRQNRL